MNTETTAPRYFRLLEKGETIKQGDCWLEKRGGIVKTTLGGQGYKIEDTDGYPALRPVQVDEWIPYAERKPTKEDFEPIGMLEIFGARSPRPHFVYTHSELEPYIYSHWRRITPPQPAKPKSVEVPLINSLSGAESRRVSVNSDGTVTVACGDILSSESIDKFIKTREEIMKQ